MSTNGTFEYERRRACARATNASSAAAASRRVTPPRWISVLAISIGCWGIAGCGEMTGDAEEFGEADEVGESTAALYGASAGPGSIPWWNSAPGVRVTVPVCFSRNAHMNLDELGVDLGNRPSWPGLDTAREWIRTHTENTWGRAANIEFTGWDTQCASFNNGRDADDLRHPSNIGKIMFYVVKQFGDNGTTPGWSAWPVGKSTVSASGIAVAWNSATLEDYRYPAVHEVGHALGFLHEQAAPDNWLGGVKQRCLAPGDGETAAPGGILYSPWVDGDSVMCYGSQLPPETLSPGDVVGIQRRYGRKYMNALVGHNGMCANLEGGSTANGASMIAWPCENSWNSRLARPAGLPGLLQTTANQRCLAVSGNRAPGYIVAWNCVNQGNEQFEFGNAFMEGAEWRAMGNMCVEPSGSRLVVKPCNGSAVQKWGILSAARPDQIVHQPASLSTTKSCVTIQSASGAMGEELRLAPCSSTDTKQRLRYGTMGAGGVIGIANNANLCLNVSGGQPTPGSPLILWNGCSLTDTHNAKFSVKGHLKTMGHCVQIQGTAGPGNRLRAVTCDNNNPNQIWEYFF